MPRYTAGQAILGKGAPLTDTETLNKVLFAGEFCHLLGLGDQGPGRDEDPRAKNTVKVRNDSGADRVLGEVLEVDDTNGLLTELRPESLWFKGVTPNAQRVFGILRDPVKSGEIEQLQVAGVCVAKVNFSHADHRAAYVVAEQHVLRSALVGPVQIVHKPSAGTGEQECVVLLTPRAPMPGLVQIFEIFGGYTAGDLLLSNPDGYHLGRLRQIAGKQATDIQQAWVRMVDWHDDDIGHSPQVNTIAEQTRYHVGMIQGMTTSIPEGGSQPLTLPLVLVDLGDTTYLSQPEADIAKGNSGDVRLYNRDETFADIIVTAKALGYPVFEDKWTTTVRFRGGAWYVGCWEV